MTRDGQPWIFKGGEDDDNNLPGTPWTPPEPSPDGGSPEGDGKHRK